MKAVVAAFNQEKALVGAFSVITNLRMELFEALEVIPPHSVRHCISVCAGAGCRERARARDRGTVPVRLLLLLLRQGLVAGHRGAERGAAVLQGGRRDGGVVAP